MDSSFEAKKRKAGGSPERDAASGGGADALTAAEIWALLDMHTRQIQTLVAANRALEESNSALEGRCDALEAKCQTRCNSLERSIKVLKKDVKWTYSAPVVPRSYWLDTTSWVTIEKKRCKIAAR